MAINDGETILEKAIGKGAYFPITITENDNGNQTWAALNGDIDLIKQNITSLFVTDIGFRCRLEQFGTRLVECLEEPDTQALEFLIELYIKEAITSWEPRVNILDINLIHHGLSSVNITITIEVILTQTVTSLSFDLNMQNSSIDF